MKFKKNLKNPHNYIALLPIQIRLGHASGIS